MFELPSALKDYFFHCREHSRHTFLDAYLGIGNAERMFVMMAQCVFLAAPLPTTGRETAFSIIVATMRLQQRPPRSMHNSSTVINNSLDPGGNYQVLTVCGNSAYGNP